LISKSARLVAGRVEIASKPNHGTRLAVKIPV
jgi:signal transduction histidine kinase